MKRIVAHPLQPFDQPPGVDSPARERGGRLVEQQDAGLAEDGTRDLDLLAQGQVEAADLAEGLDPGDLDPAEPRPSAPARPPAGRPLMG